MYHPLAFISLIVLLSLSVAVSTVNIPTRRSSLVARGRTNQDLASTESPKFQSFNETVKLHLKVVEPDLKQDFDEWRLDMTSEYWFQRFRLWGLRHDKYPELKNVDEAIRELDIEAAAALAASESPPYFAWSIYALDLYVLWIMKRLTLLQIDVRDDIYKSMVDWSKGLHEACRFEYTPYPAGIGAVLLQVQTMRDWEGPPNTCWDIIFTSYGPKFYPMHRLLTTERYFSNLQRLCNAALKECKFTLSAVEPDFEPSKAQASGQ